MSKNQNGPSSPLADQAKQVTALIAKEQAAMRSSLPKLEPAQRSALPRPKRGSDQYISSMGTLQKGSPSIALAVKVDITQSQAEVAALRPLSVALHAFAQSVDDKILQLGSETWVGALSVCKLAELVAADDPNATAAVVAFRRFLRPRSKPASAPPPSAETPAAIAALPAKSSAA